MQRSMYVKTGIIGLWLAISYALLLLSGGAMGQTAVTSFSAGLAIAGLGFCVQHDGGHGAYSRYKALNRTMAMVLDLLGASSYVWRYKHNVLHHTYTNVDGVDDDISIVPLARLAPNQPRYAFQRWQHFYIWGLYALITLKWQWWDDFHNVMAGRIGQQTFPRPRGRDLVVLIGGKLAFVTWALIIPAVVQGFVTALCFYLISQAVAGVVLASVFQLAHCVEGVQWSQRPTETLPQPRLPWAEHQLATTVDFARHSRWATWYLGGLNFQAVHHLFPRICHVHYPELSKILEHTCREYDVPYLTHPSAFHAVASHYRWLRQMGRPAAA